MVEERDVADGRGHQSETLSEETRRQPRHQPEEQGQTPKSGDKRSQPGYSLAGPQKNAPSSGVYVDPLYRKLNPSYGKEEEEPVWGLAKPLPRVVRSGMRQDSGTNEEAYEAPEKGEAEAVPQVDNIPTEDADSTSQPTDKEGASHEQAVRKHEEDRVSRPVENEAQERPPAPEEDERQAEPEKQELFNRWAKIRHYIREPLAEWLGVSLNLLHGCRTRAMILY